jgi:hypothetical protein
MLLMAAAGCDQNDIPNLGLPETVDELIVVTTTQAPETTAEPETEAVTEEPDVPEETQALETETLPDEAAQAMLDAILLDAALHAFDPIEMDLAGELRLTTQLYGFSGTTQLPLAGYYGQDRDGDVACGYTVPMVGTGFYTAVDSVLYMNNGKSQSIRCRLDKATAEELRALAQKEILSHMGALLPGDGSAQWPELLPDGWTVPEEWMNSIPEEWFGYLPEAWLENLPADGLPSWDADSAVIGNDGFKLMLCSCLAGIPLENAFASVTAVKVENGEVMLILSGLSEAFIRSFSEAVAAMEAQTQPSEISALKTLCAILSEQADSALEITVTVSTEGEVRHLAIRSELDLTDHPDLTGNIPTQLSLSLSAAISRKDVDILPPEGAEAYTEVTLEELLRADTPADIPVDAPTDEGENTEEPLS